MTSDKTAMELVLEKLADLGNRGLTHNDAAFHLGVFDLGEQVKRLQQRGHKIVERQERSITGKPVTRFVLERK